MTATELRQWRERQQWSQTQAADWYGVSVRQWRRYEHGVSRVPRPLERRIHELQYTERGESHVARQ